MFIRAQQDTYSSVRGTYLILAEPPDVASIPRDKRLRAFLRYVRLSQCGHFMMGRAKIGEEGYTLSGSAGSDGLPLTVPADTWQQGIEVPGDIQLCYWTDTEGWNSIGSRPAAVLRKWATENEKVLKQAGRKQRIYPPFVPSWEPQEAGPVNLECETKDTLEKIRALKGRSLRYAADKLFPGRRGRYLLLRTTYRYIAGNVLYCRGHRLAGRTEDALHWEAYGDTLYNDLPEWARW